MARSKITSWGLLLLSLCFLAVSCGNLTQENYEKIKVGMSYQEVEKILGPNPTCDSAMGMKTCTWGTAEKNVTVSFVADKVALHSAKGLK
ncbi:MAG: outer membrane protein assembly factor BamE [Syntrophaceae bacterium]